ncbi:MAG: hypothetical protein GY801_45765 [bacterium]|nr:hypothetical protein [bacterium]
MNERKKRLFAIEIAYWLGIGADALWAVGLLSPQLFGMLTGNPDFIPDIETRLIMGIGASLMTGWTFLLVWAVRKPIERRGVILLTAFPVVFGLFVVAFIGFLGGKTSNLWILIKNTILIVSMVTSYVLAGKMDRKEIDIYKRIS